MNLYAYCGNDPVNKYYPSGHIAISTIIGIIIGVVALAATANDIYQIARGEDNGEGLKVTISGDNVRIKNSYKIHKKIHIKNEKSLFYNEKMAMCK